MSGELTEAIQGIREFVPEDGWGEAWVLVKSLWGAVPLWGQFSVGLFLLLAATFNRIAPGVAMIIRARRGGRA